VAFSHTTSLQNIEIQRGEILPDQSGKATWLLATPPHSKTLRFNEAKSFPIRVAKPRGEATPSHSKTLCLFRLFLYGGRGEARGKRRTPSLEEVRARAARGGGADKEERMSGEKRRSKSPLADAAKKKVNVATHALAVEPPLVKAAKGRGESATLARRLNEPTRPGSSTRDRQRP